MQKSTSAVKFTILKSMTVFIAHQVLYLQTIACQIYIRLSTLNADAWATWWVKGYWTTHISTKWNLFTAQPSQPLAPHRQAKKKHMDIQLGCKPITPFSFSYFTPKNSEHAFVFFFLVFLSSCDEKNADHCENNLSKKTLSQPKISHFFDMWTQPKMDLGNLAVTTLIWLSRLS